MAAEAKIKNKESYDSKKFEFFCLRLAWARKKLPSSQERWKLVGSTGTGKEMRTNGLFITTWSQWREELAQGSKEKRSRREASKRAHFRGDDPERISPPELGRKEE